jgi:hypothetical protein
VLSDDEAESARWLRKAFTTVLIATVEAAENPNKPAPVRARARKEIIRRLPQIVKVSRDPSVPVHERLALRAILRKYPASYHL